MALVSIHRSPTPTGIDDSSAFDCTDANDIEPSASSMSKDLSECYFTVRGAAVILSHSDHASISSRSSDVNNKIEDHLQGMLRILRPEDTLSMAVCLQSTSSDNHTKYLAILSTTLPNVLAYRTTSVCSEDAVHSESSSTWYCVTDNINCSCCCDCGQELSSREGILRKLALVGFDFFSDGTMSIGVIVPIHRSSRIELDGDGGVIVIDSASSRFLFKPISIQSMWSLFQCLHKELALISPSVKPPSPTVHFDYNSLCADHHDVTQFCLADQDNYWLTNYKAFLSADDSIRAEWHLSLVDDAAKEDFKANGETATSTFHTCTTFLNDCHKCLSSSVMHPKNSVLQSAVSRQEKECCIRSNLKHIMQSVDLDGVTSRDIRNRLTGRLNYDLHNFKEFIDREMLVILGQLDRPSKIFDYLYLGTEWNASNWDELNINRVKYILNVTQEVDNFFPARFVYLKIWVTDEASTELLLHWQRTYNFIKEAKEKRSVVLVHCKKGISRSSSTVIAYIMKEYGWSLEKSLEYVKKKRDCITPNAGFMQQLQTFYGVLQASNNRHSAIFNSINNSTFINSSHLRLGSDVDESEMYNSKDKGNHCMPNAFVESNLRANCDASESGDGTDRKSSLGHNRDSTIPFFQQQVMVTQQNR